MSRARRRANAWKALMGGGNLDFPQGAYPNVNAGPMPPPTGQWLRQPLYPAFTPQWYGGQADWGQQIVSPALAGRYLPGATRDFAREAGELWNNGTVSVCLGWLADRAVQPHLVVTPDDGSNDLDPIEGHELPALLKAPNTHDDGDTFLQSTLLSYVCDGNAYWHKVRSGDGRVVELEWLPHWAVRARWPPNANVYVTYYDYLIRGNWWPIRPEDIVHFKNGVEPNNVRLGRSRLKAVLRSVVGDNEADSYLRAIMTNMGVSPVVFTPKVESGPMTPDEAKELKKQFRAANGGDNRGDPLFMSGALEMHQVAANPEQMALDKVQAIPMARICAAIGVAPMAVGLPDSQRTYSNYEEATDASYQTLTSILRRFATVLSRDEDFVAVGTERVDFDYRHIPAMQEDHNQKADRVVQLWTNDLMDQAEARGELGLPTTPEMEGVLFSDLNVKRQQDAAEHQAGLDEEAADSQLDRSKDAAEHAAALEPADDKGDE